MSRKVLWAIIVSIVIVAGFIGARSLMASPEKAAPELIPPSAGQSYFPAETLADEQGAVVVVVSQLNLNGPSDTLDFEIALDTHSFDLSMDLAKNAFLTTDIGLSISATKWDAPSGGHHVSGTLSFPVSLGDQVVLEGAEQVTLTIRNLDAPKRVFTWELQPAS
jgi:hypothetical protein